MSREQMIAIPSEAYANMMGRAMLGFDVKVQIGDLGFVISNRQKELGSGIIYQHGEVGMLHTQFIIPRDIIYHGTHHECVVISASDSGTVAIRVGRCTYIAEACDVWMEPDEHVIRMSSLKPIVPMLGNAEEEKPGKDNAVIGIKYQGWQWHSGDQANNLGSYVTPSTASKVEDNWLDSQNECNLGDTDCEGGQEGD